MSSKQPKRLTAGEKGTKLEVQETKGIKSSSTGNSSSSSSSSHNNNNNNNEDDYEKGKKTRSNNNRDELDADRKAVEDLDKWEY